MKKIICLIAMALMSITGTFAQNYQGIIYVTPTGAGTHSGNSWANATSSIETAQSLAQTHNAVVWVAAGIYYGNTSSTNAFTMVDGVNVYGGFVGNEPANYDLSLRDFELNATILDGQQARQVLNQPLCLDFDCSGSTWDGFTIRNGSGLGVSLYLGELIHCRIYNNTGGGINATYSSSISNCQIYNNTATIHGGGVCMNDNCTLSNCQIFNNSASEGGGVYAVNSRVYNCQIYNNTGTYCGGICAYANDTILDCQIYNNTADYFAGIEALNNTFISDCIIFNNNGVGAYLLDYCSISNCNIHNNDGLGIYINNSSSLSNCHIHHNNGLGASNNGNSTLSNCVIYNNDNGGVFTSGNSLIINSTIVRNNSSSNASGISGNNSTVKNCIVWGNNGPYGLSNVDVDLTCSYSAIEGGALGTNNVVLLDCIQQTPLFVNPSLTVGSDDTTSDVNWHLLPGSPCINRGENTAVIDSFDLEGNPRIGHDTVDIGCFESDYYSSPIITPQYTDVIYVTQSGAGNQTGDSWANATSSISFAMLIAHVYNTDVWVASGTYYGDTTSTNAFTMMEGINVYGGFVGNEPANYDLSLRDFNLNATILDGQQARRVLNQPSNFNTSTTWDGFTIQNGKVTGSYEAGGGACLRKNGMLSHCYVFNNNTAYIGGGVYAMANSAISYCQISNNSASSSGGGIYASNCTISHCQIINNTSITGGGLMCSNNVVSDCLISNNSASNDGGGIYGFENTTVTSSQISNNTSSESGGGVYVEWGTLSDCQIINNTANASGGGVFSIYCSMNNCLISNNSASEYGGGVWGDWEGVMIYNSTIVRNLASLSGGGVCSEEDMGWNNPSTMINCIVWGNESDSSKNVQNAICSYSAVEGGYEGESNITLSDLNPPYFINPSLSAGATDSTPNVDWHLQQGSVCINRGNNNDVMDSLDLDGLARVQRDTVDLGCYESDYYSSPLLECVTQFSEFTEIACNTYVWNDSIYTQTGDYSQTLTNVYGCDSVVTIHLSIHQSTHNAENTSACNSYDWNGATYTESGTYTYEYTNADGCPSVDTLYLTVNYSTTDIDEQIACESFTWIDGVTYTESTNTPIFTLTNAAGCDSIVTLHLTIYESATSEFSIVTEDPCYTWNNVEYCETDDYTQTLQTVHGCDSIVTLHLTITVGIDDYNDLDFKVYPNPTSNVVNVQCTMNNVQLGEVEIQIVDMYGKLVRTVVGANNYSPLRTRIDISDLANGVYFVKLVAEDKTIAVRKVVKQ